MSSSGGARVSSFRLRVHANTRVPGAPVRTCSGRGEDWHDYTTLSVEGFNGSATLKLDDVWRRALEDRQSRVVATCEALETIVKFGSTMQLRHDFKVVLEVKFEED